MPIEDVKEALAHPFVCMGSDGSMSIDPVSGKHSGHPRCAGATGRFLRMVREEGLVDLPIAVRKLTLEPANMIKLPSKARLQEGKDADITVFDFETVAENSKFGNSVCALPPTGIAYVICGGRGTHRTSKQEFVDLIETTRARLKPLILGALNEVKRLFVSLRSLFIVNWRIKARDVQES